MTDYPAYVELIEVGPRDGLQAESRLLDLAQKKAWLDTLAQCGYSLLEVGSLVNPRLVPQMADTAELFERLDSQADNLMLLVGNLRWLSEAADIGVKRVSMLASASETFALKNINRTLAQNLHDLSEMLSLCRQHGITSRVYISCSFHCPYEGNISAQQLISVLQPLVDMGCDEVSLADTTGHATPLQLLQLFQSLDNTLTKDRLALHFHNTRGQALSNALISLQHGFYRFDTSVAGLGGCPYAPGAKGNLATEELLFMLDGLGIRHGVSVDCVNRAKQQILEILTADR